jgi:hypothetical protein
MHAELPPRIAATLTRLHAGPIHFAPVRHHSPACARALAAMLAELQPVRILIEGPPALAGLLPLLRDPACQPPVAVLLRGEEDTAAAGWYPLCDYSPEWVAMRWPGAEVRFIDAPWSTRAPADQGSAASLLAERHLSRSAEIAALAAAAGCRDHDELWEHAFELKPLAAIDDWRTHFGEVFAWCALSRLGDAPEVQGAEGHLAREALMVAALHSALAEGGTTVVVTGGYHTLPLVEALDAKPARAKPPKATDRAWLVRYSFDRLDALNGYGAGMLAVAWQQRLWEAWATGMDAPWRHSALESLLDFAAAERAAGAEGLSTATLQAALLQAEGLAALRGHPGPGRMDLIDAVRSCCVKLAVNEGGARLIGALNRTLAGSRMGNVPAGSGSPPLLEQARAEARALGIRLEETTSREVSLDLLRKPRHRVRSRYLRRMNALGTGLAEWLAGPDFRRGMDIERLHERWRVAWSPAVEARLIDLAAQGARLEDVALAQLMAQAAQLSGRNAAAVVGLLLEACLLGLPQALAPLAAQLSAALAEDPELASVTEALAQLLALAEAGPVLELVQAAPLEALTAQAESAALRLLPLTARVADTVEAATIAAMVALRGALRRRFRETPAGRATWVAALTALADDPDAAPGIAAAAMALLALDHADADRDAERLGSGLARHFGIGAQPTQAVRWLTGLLTVSPQQLLHSPALVQALDACLARWTEDEYMAHLPDLRRAFTGLKPIETDALARTVAAHHPGASARALTEASPFTLGEVQAATALERRVVERLRAAGLAGWIGP